MDAETAESSKLLNSPETFGGRALRPAGSSWLRDLLAGELLHPIIVKELRQELKARAFTISFLAPPLLYCLGLVFLSGIGMREVMMQGFWTLMGLLLFLQPIGRAFGTFTNEERAKSLELLQLTGLSSFEIVIGKWAALILQTALLTLVMVPFIAVHYFFFGAELIEDFRRLGIMCLTSVAVITLSLTFSASNFGQGRKVPSGLLVFFFLFGGWSILIALSHIPTMLGTAAGRMRGPFFIFWILICSSVVLLQLLLFSASRITRSYEAFGRPFRVAGLICAAAGSILSVLGLLAPAPLLVGFAAVLGISGVLTLCDQPRWREVRLFPSRLRQLRECFRLDGWPGGVLYVVLFCLAAAPGVLAVPLFDMTEQLLIIVTAMATLLFPRALLGVLFPSTSADVIRTAIAHLTLLGMGSFALWLKALPLAALYPPILPSSRVWPEGSLLLVIPPLVLSFVLYLFSWRRLTAGRAVSLQGEQG